MKKIILLFLVGLALSQSMERHVFDSSGDVGTDYGYSLGQTAVGFSTTAESDTGTVGYWHTDWEAVICVSISDEIWNVVDSEHPDTIPAGSTISMVESDVIEVLNCGNAPIDLGLVYMSSDADSFEVGYYQGINRAVLRAQFRDDEVVPTVYDVARDYLKNSVSWANDLTFGPAGWGLAIAEVQNLWLQFVAPTSLTGGETSYNITMTIELRARYYLP